MSNYSLVSNQMPQSMPAYNRFQVCGAPAQQPAAAPQQQQAAASASPWDSTAEGLGRIGEGLTGGGPIKLVEGVAETVMSAATGVVEGIGGFFANMFKPAQPLPQPAPAPAAPAAPVACPARPTPARPTPPTASAKEAAAKVRQQLCMILTEELGRAPSQYMLDKWTQRVKNGMPINQARMAIERMPMAQLNTAWQRYTQQPLSDQQYADFQKQLRYGTSLETLGNQMIDQLDTLDLSSGDASSDDDAVDDNTTPVTPVKPTPAPAPVNTNAIACPAPVPPVC